MQNRVEILPFLRDRIVGFTDDDVLSYLYQTAPAKQAFEKGQSMISSSQVRGLKAFNTVEGCFVEAYIEPEYHSSDNLVYRTTAILGTQPPHTAIRSTSCVCIASNRTTGKCKHEAALLLTLFILHRFEAEFSKNPPLWARRSRRTLKLLKGASSETLAEWRVYPWDQTVDLFFQPWESQKKLRNSRIPAPQKGRRSAAQKQIRLDWEASNPPTPIPPLIQSSDSSSSVSTSALGEFTSSDDDEGPGITSADAPLIPVIELRRSSRIRSVAPSTPNPPRQSQRKRARRR